MFLQDFSKPKRQQLLTQTILIFFVVLFGGFSVWAQTHPVAIKASEVYGLPCPAISLSNTEGLASQTSPACFTIEIEEPGIWTVSLEDVAADLDLILYDRWGQKRRGTNLFRIMSDEIATFDIPSGAYELIVRPTLFSFDPDTSFVLYSSWILRNPSSYTIQQLLDGEDDTPQGAKSLEMPACPSTCEETRFGSLTIIKDEWDWWKISHESGQTLLILAEFSDDRTDLQLDIHSTGIEESWLVIDEDMDGKLSLEWSAIDISEAPEEGSFFYLRIRMNPPMLQMPDTPETFYYQLRVGYRK